MQQNAMLNDLAQIIRTYVDGHKNRSLKGLSMRTGVAYATLRRILMQDAIPTMENILRSSSLFAPRKKAFLFLKDIFHPSVPG